MLTINSVIVIASLITSINTYYHRELSWLLLLLLLLLFLVLQLHAAMVSVCAVARPTRRRSSQKVEKHQGRGPWIGEGSGFRVHRYGLERGPIGIYRDI